MKQPMQGKDVTTQPHGRRHMGKSLEKQSDHLTRLCLVLSFSFVLLVGPASIWFLVLQSGAVAWMDDRSIDVLTFCIYTLDMLNHSSNFIFYLILIPSLRQDLKNMVSHVFLSTNDM